MISLLDVTKNYPDGTVAVDDLTLEVADGEICALVGPLGLRQDHHDADDQPADRADRRDASRSTGEDVTGLDVQQLRRGIGYVIQSAGLFPH